MTPDNPLALMSAARAPSLVWIGLGTAGKLSPAADDARRVEHDTRHRDPRIGGVQNEDSRS